MSRDECEEEEAKNEPSEADADDDCVKKGKEKMKKEAMPQYFLHDEASPGGLCIFMTRHLFAQAFSQRESAFKI